MRRPARSPRDERGARIRDIVWERRVGIITAAALATAAVVLVVAVAKGQNR